MPLRTVHSDSSGGLSRLLSPALRWTLLLGVLVHLIGFLLFRVVTSPLPVTEEKRPFIVFLPDQAMSEGALLEARASLFDSAPLFVPTRWSTSARVYPDFDSQGHFAFEDYLPSISLVDELRPRKSFGLEEYEVERPEDLLALRFLSPWQSFGQDQEEPARLNDWSPVAHVRVIGGGELTNPAESKILRASSLSELASSEGPVKFYLNISASGRLFSRPVLVESSGLEEVDASVMDWILDPETIARLPTGYLEVSVYL